MECSDDDVWEESASKTHCPNPACSDGYAPRSCSDLTLRVCPSCDGLGYLRGAAENRKRYMALRNAATELEMQSRAGRQTSNGAIWIPDGFELAWDAVL